MPLFLLGCAFSPGTNSPTPWPPTADPPPARILEIAPPTASVTVSMGLITTTPSATPRLPAAPALTTTPAITPTRLPATTTPDPFANLTIDALAGRAYGGGQLDIVDTLERGEDFARYLITYPSDDLTIYGFMNVPNQGSKFPVVILLHGYLPPAAYQTVDYTKRYADTLAEAGFFVIHPNLRGYPPSDSGPDLFRTGMAIDVLNLIAIIREQSQDPLGYLRRADADNIHLWGHSMGGGIALRVITVNNDPYLKSAVLYGAMSGDEALNYDQIRQWRGGQRDLPELNAPAETMAAISPIDHLPRLTAAVSIHHSDADEVVPVAWSEALCQKLEMLDHPAECFIYHGAPHTFHTLWDDAFIARTIDFYRRH